ncbi:DnaJ like protein subfamily C member 7 [Myotis brandtii]|uniref:DnaJ like protein subfamily C member 7 n=1 Tax=Myotis brandtii TaxID=109478 RepID=S7MQ26_MYOBR|nr:DnaJ like protein subfamily C member 7 [Myotis brandtii]
MTVPPSTFPPRALPRAARTGMKQLGRALQQGLAEGVASIATALGTGPGSLDRGLGEAVAAPTWLPLPLAARHLLWALESFKTDSKTLEDCIPVCEQCALKFAPACHCFKILQAEYLAMLGHSPEAQSVAGDIFTNGSTNVDALYVRGLCLYYEGRIEKMVQFFVQALRMAPDHEKACVACRNAKTLKAKRDGNKPLKEGNCKLAKEQSIKVLGIDPNTIKTNAKFFSGTVHSKLREPYDAIEDCTDAGKLGGMCVKAFWRRAQCYMDTEDMIKGLKKQEAYENVYWAEKTHEQEQLKKFTAGTEEGSLTSSSPEP